MATVNEDPVVRRARREGLVAIVIWLLATLYTVGYCWKFAYQRPAEDVRFVWGIPDWILWGIVLPWAVCVVVSWWYAYGFMTDEPLGAESSPPEDE